MKQEIIAKEGTVSIATLTSIYGQDEIDHSARSRLKERIVKVFPNLIFLKPNKNSLLIAVNSIN